MEAISARLYFFFNWIKCWCLQPYCLCKLADFRFRGLQIDEHINLPCGDSHSQVLGMLLLEVLLTSFTYDSLSVLLYQDSWPWRPLKMPSRMHSLTCYLSRVRGRWKDHLLFFRQVVFSFRVFFSDGIAFSLFLSVLLRLHSNSSFSYTSRHQTPHLFFNSQTQSVSKFLLGI